jgi:hypothetical protein
MIFYLIYLPIYLSIFMSIYNSMPISSPPQNYNLNPIGTSGIAVGPDILIVDEDLHPLPSGCKGNIFVRGPPCFGK